MNIFGFGNTPSAAPADTTPSDPATPSAPNAQPSTPPVDPAAPPSIPDEPNLEFFNSLVENPQPSKPNQPMSVKNDLLTPENLKKIAQEQQFSRQISPETLEKLKTGEGSAIMAAMEEMAKAAYTTALSQSGAILDAVIGQHVDNLRSAIPTEVQSTMTRREITAGIPNIDQPIVKAGAEMIADQIRAKFPQASPDQIRSMTQHYFTQLAAAVNPSPVPPAGTPTAPAEATNWMEFAGFSQPSNN